MTNLPVVVWSPPHHILIWRKAIILGCLSLLCFGVDYVIWYRDFYSYVETTDAFGVVFMMIMTWFWELLKTWRLFLEYLLYSRVIALMEVGRYNVVSEPCRSCLDQNQVDFLFVCEWYWVTFGTCCVVPLVVFPLYPTCMEVLSVLVSVFYSFRRVWAKWERSRILQVL